MTEAKTRISLREIAEATPAGRDRYVDLLRVFSICVVVLGHWLIAAIYWRDGEISGLNALDHVPYVWLATWILQVMPLFFFVGGFSNAVTLRSIHSGGGGYAQFIYGRVERLMRPTTVFLAVWIPITILLQALSALDRETLDAATTLLTRPLWFIGIYLIMIAFAPLMLKVHTRFRFNALIFMGACAVAVDTLELFPKVPFIGYLNFAFVWLLVHQFGFFYADGTLRQLSRRTYLAMAISGLVVLALLTGPGPYASSMVGLQDERSNTNPPTIAIIALTVWQIGLAMLLRDRVSRWLSGVRPWMVVIWVGSVIMTLFLWHQTAMLLAVGALYPIGFPQPELGSAQWWLVRPLWLLSLATFLAPLILIFGRFERGRPRRVESAPESESSLRPIASVVAISYVILGILGFAVSGMDSFADARGESLVFFSVNPLQNVVHLVLAAFLLRASVVDGAKARMSIGFAALTFVVLGLAGVLLDGSMNVLAANEAVNVLHFVTAAMLIFPLLDKRQNR